MDGTLGVVLVLASSSPARLRLLRQAGVDPRVVVSDVDEEAVAQAHGSAPVPEVAEILARAKAEAVSARLLAAGDGAALVLGCDSIFELDGRPYGKPGDPGEARRRLRAMRGRSGVLHTGHAVVRLDGTGAVARTSCVVGTQVSFAPMTDDEIDWYVATGEPLAVAGSFTLDGYSSPYVAGIVGDPGNVVGVSLPAVRSLAAEVGVPWADIVAGPSASGAGPS